MAATNTLQPGILALGTPAHHHLQFSVTDSAAILDRVGQLRDQLTTVVGVNVVVGFGPSMWRSMRPEQSPPGIDDFAEMSANNVTLPSAQHDMWLWLHGGTVGSVLDAALLAKRTLRGAAELATEQQAFAYGASQDLTGFEDGT